MLTNVLLWSIYSKSVGGDFELAGCVSEGQESQDPDQDANRLRLTKIRIKAVEERHLLRSHLNSLQCRDIDSLEGFSTRYIFWERSPYLAVVAKPVTKIDALFGSATKGILWGAVAGIP